VSITPRTQRVAPGNEIAPRTIGPVTQTDIVRFAGAGGDFNPLHHDPVLAARSGFAAPIAMGQFTAGLLAAWLTDWCGVENLRSYEVRFRAPVNIGDLLVLSGAIREITEEADGDRLAAVDLWATCGDTVAVSGGASVRVVA
jgi:3-hydroxybutyryl-CoA dehydratase